MKVVFMINSTTDFLNKYFSNFLEQNILIFLWKIRTHFKFLASFYCYIFIG